jgi:multidrug efflux pump subunit AcrA (membrane-fusion protein)
MIRKYLLPLIGSAMFVFAVIHMVNAQQSLPKLPPPVTPPRASFTNTVAGVGIIEPETENINIGSHYPGVVSDVFVKVGQPTRKGHRLFQIDDRSLKAERQTRLSALESAKAQVRRLEQMPRPEELPPARARLLESEENLKDQQDQYDRMARLAGTNAIADSELIRRKQALLIAKAQRERAKAELALLESGAWKADLDIARAAVEQAKAALLQTEQELKRMVVESPVDGKILQVNLRPGEFVGASPGQSLIVLGGTGRLHVRVDIDENDIPRYRSGISGRIRPRGGAETELPISFVRVEPMVIPKRSLSGASTERVDTRVLQVVYAVERSDSLLFVGQQVDVYFDASEGR